MRPIIPERYGRRIVRALVVSNMLPDAAHPERGRFVRDQVQALRRLEGLDVTLYEFPPGAAALLRAARELHRRFDGQRFDVVHAHFGLTAWPAFAVSARARALTFHGTDLVHPRTRIASRLVLPAIALPAAVSSALVSRIPGRAAARAAVLPCGVDVERFRPLPREQARAALSLDPQRAYLLFPADPARPEKRYDRARLLAERSGATLLHLGGVEPEQVPLWVNAANAVAVPSEREGFGLAVLEALACDVPVLATPVGVHAEAIDTTPGTLCAEFQLDSWTSALAPHLRERDPRIAGREHACRYSALAMAEVVRDAWQTVAGGSV
jgi:teichuronic acid biosynthesis glycosyltransferase TuaC